MRRSTLLLLVVTLLAFPLFAAPAGAQEFTFQDIPWGSDVRSTVRQLAGLGYARDDAGSQPGELLFENDEGLQLIASFAAGRLVGIRTFVLGSEAQVEALWEAFLSGYAADYGRPDVEEEGQYVWWRRETALSVSVLEAEDGAFFVVQFSGPGYNEEVDRRAAQGGAVAGANAYPPLDPRWQVVGDMGRFRSAFDRNTIQPQGGRVLRVWVRDDYSGARRGAVEYDQVLSQVDYDCARNRLRVVTHSYRLQGRLVETQPPAQSPEWMPIPPESIAERQLAAICQAGERR